MKISNCLAAFIFLFAGCSKHNSQFVMGMDNLVRTVVNNGATQWPDG